MGNENFDKQIEKAFETYKKMVKEYFKYKEIIDMLSIKKEYIKKKADINQINISQEIKEIDKKLKYLMTNEKKMEQKINCENSVFEVRFETIMNAMYKHLCKIYNKNDIKLVCDVLESEEYNVDRFYYVENYFSQRYSIGYTVRFKEYLLPISKDIYYEPVKRNAYEALLGGKKTFNILKLMNGKVKCFASDDWQEIFWGLVKQNLISKLNETKKCYQEEMERTKKEYENKIEKLKERYEIELELFQLNEDEFE